ncbi:actin-like ATPase domain-containing protein [Pholiota conissans]|uniref:Actin-like ATPase domain-containing protein n=1 Tax=Pholiota conissans TaxID=109636 RepID=A0A9P5YR22_9AGAR|nr:actin-like ATPase domain-containing protein [Pholiota conissans]
MATKSLQNGSAEVPIEISTLPPVVGINFGNSYASIAVFTKEGLAECIANEDGERQIACAIAFHGEEMYIGNQAKQQLVKNAPNSIVGFRNLLGKKFSEIPQTENTTSARVIQHPELPDTAAYKVQVLQPSPAPLSNTTSAYTTPAASHAPTPRSEPILVDRILTVSEVVTIFLKSLVKSAEDFLGKQIKGAVISVPSTFTEEQKDALEKAAQDAGVTVLQLLDEAGAAAATTTTPTWSGDSLRPDRTQLLVDFGSSAVSLSLLSVREGLTYILAASNTSAIGANQIDDKLIKFFAADFTKKMKVPLTVCPATSPADQRAEAKLRLAIEHTKRTISASPGAATCSVESLKDGMDFTGSINRMRFDMLGSPIYASVAAEITALLASAAIDPHDVDEVVYIGGTGCLPGLDNRLCTEVGLREDVETPFARGTIVGGGLGDPTTILARGCATQAALIDSIQEEELRAAFGRGHEAREVKATTKTIGVLFPNSLEENKEVGGTWIPVVQKETALPVRRIVSFDVEVTEGSKRIAFEVWEVKEGIRVEKVVQSSLPSSDDEDDEEPEETEIKHRTLAKEVLLGAIDTQAQLAIQTKGKGKDVGKWFTRVEVQFIVSLEGALDVELREVGPDGVVERFHVSAL